jgi:AraC-like DNA-binding protein
VRPFVIPRGVTVIELLTRGVIYFSWDGADLKLGPGALFWHMEGEETICRTSPDDPYQCLSIRFRVVRGMERTVPRLSVIGDRQRVDEISREILAAYHDESVGRDILGEYAWSRLQWEAHLGMVKNLRIETPPAVRAAVARIEVGFRRSGLSVGELARAARLSEPHLHELFRDHVGQSPHHFVVARRVREAKWRLTGSDETIKSIAVECGFANIETFYRAFKRRVGTTPYEYRRTHALPILASTLPPERERIGGAG